MFITNLSYNRNISVHCCVDKIIDTIPTVSIDALVPLYRLCNASALIFVDILVNLDQRTKNNEL